MQKEQRSYTYILANGKNDAIYVGVTSNLRRRVFEHKEKIIKGFTEKYDIDQLVHYEIYGHIGLAIAREKQLKKWNRAWKVELIEKENPMWNDLYKKTFFE